MQHNASEPSAIDYGLHYGYQCYSDASIHAGTGGTFPNVTDPSAPVIDFNADFHIFGAVLNDTAITVRRFLTRAEGARSRSLFTPLRLLPPTSTMSTTSSCTCCLRRRRATLLLRGAIHLMFHSRICTRLLTTRSRRTAACSRRQKRPGRRRTSCSSTTFACTSGSRRRALEGERGAREGRRQTGARTRNIFRIPDTALR
jgi:hypothetical protein